MHIIFVCAVRNCQIKNAQKTEETAAEPRSPRVLRAQSRRRRASEEDGSLDLQDF